MKKENLNIPFYTNDPRVKIRPLALAKDGLSLIGKLKYFLFFILFFKASFPAFSQISTSVQTVVQVLPPYSLTLSDYTDAETDKLHVALFLNDPTLTSVEVKLRVRIESDKMSLITKPEFIPTKLILEDKEWLNLTGSDLAEYFKLENLNVSGTMQQGRLPEGLYRFCVEVLEYKRGISISNMVCSAPVWMILNDPPIWQLPRKNEVVEASFPQNLLFSWLPRHTGSPNALFDVEYELHVEPIFNDNVNPQAIPQIQSTFNFIETDVPNYVMNGADAIQLEPGQRYATWVRAKDRSGKDLFRNNGLSEVLVFTFGQKCQTPGDLIIITESYKQANISWTGNANNNEYILSYHEKGQSNDVWYSQTLYLPSYQLNDLKASTQYEVKLKANCSTLSSDETNVISFTTPDVPVNTFVCNDPNQSKLPPLGKTKKASLSAGDIISVRGYQVKIVQVTGSDGVFSGKGIVLVPFLQNVGLEATFSNIGVNQDNKLTSGRVDVISGQVPVIDAVAQSNVSRLQTLLTSAIDDNTTNQLVSDVNDFLENTPKIPVFAKALIEQGKDQIAQGQAMIAAGNTEAGQKLVAQGKSQLQQGLNKAGAAFSGSGGIISADAKPKTITSDPNASVLFSPSIDPVSQYGYDAYKEPLLKLKYEKVIDETTKAEVYPDWKAVESGKPDYVKVAITTAGTYKADSVYFETEDGNSLPRGQGGALTLIGGTDGSDTRVYAMYKSGKDEKRLAQINMASYDKISNKVYLVPLNGATIDASAVKETLNTTYKQAIAEFEVELMPGFNLSSGWDSDNDGKILVNASGLFSNYTKDMNAIIKAYKDANDNIDKDAYYVFIGLPASDAGQLGYMPRAKNFGFIFSLPTGEGQGGAYKTIAHELGHGAFHLKHTFDETSVPQGSSNNLMDYTDQGTFLNKYQWDFVHNPSFVIGFLESDDAGAMNMNCWLFGLVDDCEDILNILNAIKIQAAKGVNVKVKKYNFPKTFLSSESLKIESTTYGKLNILNRSEENKTYVVNLKDYELKQDPTTKEYSFYFYDVTDTKHLKTILSINVTDDDITNKIEVLKKYLFSSPVAEGTEATIANIDGTYVKFSDDFKGKYDKLFTTERPKPSTNAITISDVDLKELKDKNVYIWNTYKYYDPSNDDYQQILKDELDPGKEYNIVLGEKANVLLIVHFLSTDNEGKLVYTSEERFNRVDNFEFSCISGIQNGISSGKNFKDGFDAALNERSQLLKTKLKSCKIEAIPSFEFKESVIENIIDKIIEVKGDDYACNMCVREAFYQITGKAYLFPEQGGFTNCYSCVGATKDSPDQKVGLLNKLEPRANDIYTQLQPGGTLAPYFVEIFDKSGSEFPDFSAMQTEVNNGKVIIGAYSNPGGVGHVVIMMPESYSEKKNDDETELEGNTKILLKRPVTLECGGANKTIKQNEFDQELLKTYKWYYYNGK